MTTDEHLEREFLLGTNGDAANSLLVAAGHNLRQFLRLLRFLLALVLA